MKKKGINDMMNYNLYEIFKEKLITKSVLESLWDLLEDKTLVFNQYYQRKYVWNAEKASNFIESIILGFDIPPIVIFEEENNHSEIIDGRQRFETIKRFINNEFKLKKCGLTFLKIYNDKYYKDLDDSIKEHIKGTCLRVFRYKLSENLTESKELIDSVKKEIFKRYNIGLTPLKQYEIEKAIFIRNNLNQFIKKSLVSSSALIRNFSTMFCKEEYIVDNLSTKSIELMMKKIRFLISLPEIPINYYSWSPSKTDLINSMFRYISNDSNASSVFEIFKNNILLLTYFKRTFEKREIKANHLIFEALYWAISVIKLENLDKNILINNIELVSNSIEKNIELFTEEKSHYYKNIINRYIFITKLIEKLYNVDFDKYITTSDYSKAKIKEARDIKTKKKIRKHLSKLNSSKPDSQSFTIKTYSAAIQQSSFNLRPDYQRDDTMNVQKASGLIESILLDFKIAPIYIYTKEDGTKEVIDGQQRLLTILAFKGIFYKNEKGEKVTTKNHKFKLTGLKYLKEYNGLTYDKLPQEAKERISSFSLTIINLTQSNLPKFEPVDLFIRLNNKPYPIKEHSFEMWNATISANITEKIKDIQAKNSDWFFIRNNNKHMQNEEMITTLLYLEDSRQNQNTILPENSCNKFNIYAKATELSCSVRDKKSVSKLLEDISQSENSMSANHYIERTSEYIEKLKILLEDDEMSLKERLNKLICPNNGCRRLHNLFLLWYILAPIKNETILNNKSNIYISIQEIIKFYKTPYTEEKKEEILASFYEKIQSFWNLNLPATNKMELCK